MSTDLSFMQFIADQLHPSLRISYRKMFGEYAVYSNGKVVALACDNQLFVKPTEAGRAFLGDVSEGSPYPGAKPHLLIRDEFDDCDRLSQLIAITAQALPPPKPKKPKKKSRG